MDSLDRLDGRLPTLILVANHTGRDANMEVEEHDGHLFIHMTDLESEYPATERFYTTNGKSRVVNLEEEVMTDLFGGNAGQAVFPTPPNFANRLPARQHDRFPPTVLTVRPEALTLALVLTAPGTYADVFYDEREGLTRVNVKDRQNN